MPSVLDLPDFILEIIFSYLSLCDIKSVSIVCRLFHHICQSEYVWHNLNKRSNYSFPRRKPCFKCRSLCNGNSKRISSRKLACLRYLWLYKIKEIPSGIVFHPPKTSKFPIQFDHQHFNVWFSHDNTIYSIFQCPSSSFSYEEAIRLPHPIESFSVWNNNFVAFDNHQTLHYGEICSSSSWKPIGSVPRAHSDCGTVVDFTESCIVSGGRDCRFKIWRISDTVPALSLSHQLVDRIWTLKMMPNNQPIALLGCAALECLDPIVMFDTYRGEVKQVLNYNEVENERRRGAGIHSIDVRDNNTFLSGGYDSAMRLWDIRMPSPCVRNWFNPVDSAVSVVRSDGDQYCLVGAMQNGMIFVHDLRKHVASNYWFPPSQLLTVSKAMPPYPVHKRRLQFWKPQEVSDIVFSPERMFVSVCDTIFLSDFENYHF